MKPSNDFSPRVTPTRRPLVLVTAILITVLVLIALPVAIEALAATGEVPATTANASNIAPKTGDATHNPSDCGLFWRVVPSSNPSTTDNSLSSVDAISPNDVWAVGLYSASVGGGQYARATAQHWNGSAWSVVTVPQPGIASDLSSVSAISPTDIWAVGYYIAQQSTPTLTLAMHWDGSSWSQVPSPNPGGTAGNSLLAVTAVSSDAAWAVGAQGNGTLVMFWDGTTWASVPSPSPGTTSYFMSASADDVDDMWAVGAYREAGARYDQTLIVHCSRSGCTESTSPDPGIGNNDLNGVVSLSASEVWAVGYSEVITDPAQNVPLMLRWDGLGWSALPTPPIPPDVTATIFSSAVAFSSNDVWGVGLDFNNITFQGSTYIAHWNGSSWMVVTSPNQGSVNSLNAGDALAPDDIWAVGSYKANDPNPYLNLVEHYSDPCVTPSPTPTSTPPPSCPIQFTDVPVGSTFYSYVHCLACQNILGGYSTGCSTGNPCFKPSNPVTRGQLAKIVSNSAGYNEQHTDQTFQDVPIGSTFYDFVERLASRGVIGGYACGGTGEPCVPPANLPYFRPNAQVTRGQTSKIVAIAASLPAPPAGQQTFQDVPPNSTFWQWIESLASAGTIGGYQCGGTGEPCVPPANRPYFRPNNDVTRGQAAKIVSNTFFPNCQSR